VNETKTAVITGGSSGIGRAAGIRFAAEGYRVILTARHEENLKEVCRAAGRRENLLYQAADIGKEEDVESLFNFVASSSGSLDVLINNAGVGFPGALEELSPERFDEMMKTNVRGSYLCTRAAIPLMKKKGSGHIVFVSSGAGKNGIAGLSGYCASKFAVMGLAESLALEAKLYNVKVSVLCPGSTNSEFHRNMGKEPSDEARQAMIQPEDLAATLYHMVTQPPSHWIYEVTARAFLKGR